MKPAIFLDRDGVLNKLVLRNGILASPRSVHELTIFEEAVVGVNRLKKAGFLCIVVTNQPDIARKLMKKEQLDAINARIKSELLVDDIIVCPHDDGQCNCRKPSPGMLLIAKEAHQIDFTSSWIIGDRASDIEAGFAVNVKGILIRGGQDSVTEARANIVPFKLVDTFSKAVELILSNSSTN